MEYLLRAATFVSYVAFLFVLVAAVTWSIKFTWNALASKTGKSKIDFSFTLDLLFILLAAIYFTACGVRYVLN